MTHSALQDLRARYEKAFSHYQSCIAAVSLAQTDEDGVPEQILSALGQAAEELRSARRLYRAALLAAPASAATAGGEPA